MTSLAQNYQKLNNRIQAACNEAGRPVESVQLLAVSKHQPLTKISALAELGARAFGENYLQEALAKQSDPSAGEEWTWHFIGAIQSNKTRAIAKHFDWVQTLASEKVARRLSEQRPDGRTPLNVLIQVNVDDEQSKSGVSLSQVAPLAAIISSLPNLRLRGLMAIPAPMQGEGEALRAAYTVLHDQYEALRQAGYALDTLSMGMSNDLEIAIECGATLIRVGTALFGPRESSSL